MPYLQAVLKEALRMHPATGLILGRLVPPEGVTLAGQYFSPGVRSYIPPNVIHSSPTDAYTSQTVVGINSWAAHANRDVFGNDTHIFRPERWLEDSEVVKRRESYFMTVS